MSRPSSATEPPRHSNVFATLLPALAGMLAFALPSAVPAAEGEDAGPVYAEYRLWGRAADEVDLSPAAVSAEDRPALLHQRLRLSYTQDLGNFRGVAEADLLTGSLTGATAFSLPNEADSGTRVSDSAIAPNGHLFDPRQAYIEYQSDSVGQATLGLQTSHWGLGMLANDGAAEDARLFNHNYGGDRVFRASFATAPLALASRSPLARNFIIALGADFVFRDENASLREGDRAGQGILALLYSGEHLRLGNYVTVRNQRDTDGDYLSAFALDYYGEFLWTNDAGWDFRAGAETVLLVGETNRTLSHTGDPTNIQGYGAAAEFEAGHLPSKLRLRVLTGYASGDANNDDDTLYRFRFDPNYQVGLVLFDHYLPAVTARGYRDIIDPTRSAEAPKGAAGFVNDGSVENAIYLNPRLLFGQQDGLLTGVGVLWARGVEPIADPYSTFANGGSPTGITGRTPASRDLGWEIDVATRYRYKIDLGLTFEIKGEYGLLFPGEAFASAGGTPAPPESLLRGSVAAIW